MRARLIVFGYGHLAIAAVEAAMAAETDVVAAVLPSNRCGSDIEMFRSFAMAQKIPVLIQPTRDESRHFVARLRQFEADLFLVWSYSMILPRAIYSLPHLGSVNVHGGLLPAYRGIHVLQWAIINGESETGITIHKINSGIDTGGVICQSRFPIEFTDDAVSVQYKLKMHGQSLLRQWLPRIIAGTAQPQSQDESKATHYPVRTAEDGAIDWSASNIQIYNKVRALVAPWPGAFCFHNGQKIVVRRAMPFEFSTKEEEAPGSVKGVNSTGLSVVTGKGGLLISELELNGRPLRTDEVPQFAPATGQSFLTAV